MGDLLKWKNTKISQEESYCNGWSIQGENTECFQKKNLIVMSDLLKREKNTKKESHFNGCPIQVKNTEIFQKGSYCNG